MDLMRMPRSVPLATQSWIQISQMPPDIPLPIATAACPPIKRQFFTSICSQGRPTRHPSSFILELMAMQSSPVSKVQSSISTFLHESDCSHRCSVPLVFTVTPRTTTSLTIHRVDRPLRSVLDRKIFQRYVLTIYELDERGTERILPGRKYALFYHNPLTFRPDQAIRRILLELFQCHHALPAPSNTPVPQIVTFSQSAA